MSVLRFQTFKHRYSDSIQYFIKISNSGMECYWNCTHSSIIELDCSVAFELSFLVMWTSGLVTLSEDDDSNDHYNNEILIK